MVKKYKNPIIFADYSDPDVIRVGDIFYLTASSFNYTPGLPILTSRNLVNWELVNYAVKNIAEKRYNIPRHSEGIWAPSIRYHDGMYYIYYGMPDEGIYVVRTKDPLGEWEEPVCVLEGKGLIDSCPFWDDDGRAYIIHGYAKSRIGFKSILGIFEISSDGMRAISEDKFIFDGNSDEHKAVTIEGPKVYKRDGYYYILAPAGGVKEGYQVALRSRDIHGPYEIKTVMHTGSTVINGPHQGGLVDTISGEEWFIHFQDRGLYGRICHLQPVSWKDGWPIIGVNPDEDGCGEPVYEYERPNCTLPRTLLNASEDFVGGEYMLQWQWLGNHSDSFYGRTEKENGLRLFSLNPSEDSTPVIWRSPNVLTQKLIYPMFSADITLDCSGLEKGERAGVCMTGGQYITAYIERSGDDEYVLKLAESEGGDKDKIEIVKKEMAIPEICERICLNCSDCSLDLIKNTTFRLKFVMDNEKSILNLDREKMYFQNYKQPYGGRNPSLKILVSFAESPTDADFIDLGCDYTPSDHTWVGAKIGIYALSGELSNEVAGENGHGYADFKYVHVTEA